MFTRNQRVRIASLGPYSPNPDKGRVVGGVGTVTHASGLYVYVVLDSSTEHLAFAEGELTPLVDVRLPGLDGE